ncbi:MAG: hypothetical protein Q6373_014180 [Candidatus Sigynarchaeota archaeon]
MLCGKPIHEGCSLAGFCKADIDKIWSRGGEQLTRIDSDFKRARRATKFASLGAIGFIYGFIIYMLVAAVMDLPFF